MIVQYIVSKNEFIRSDIDARRFLFIELSPKELKYNCYTFSKSKRKIFIFVALTFLVQREREKKRKQKEFYLSIRQRRVDSDDICWLFVVSCIGMEWR